MIQHAVWPTPAPPVCAAFWTQESWQRFEDRYRPVDYTGDRYDAEAWGAYRAQANRRERLALLTPFSAAIARLKGPEAAAEWLAKAMEV